MITKKAEFSLIKQPHLTLCPNTNTPVTPKNAYEFSIPGSRAWWWQCLACRGWHVTVEKTDHHEYNEAQGSLYPGYALLGAS